MAESPNRPEGTDPAVNKESARPLRSLGLLKDHWPIIVAMAISFSTVLICMAYFHAGYKTNDNLGIIDFATHGYFLSYVGSLFIWLLHFAYSQAPGTPWYPIILYALQAIS